MKKILIFFFLAPFLTFGQKYAVKSDSVFIGKPANPYLINAQTANNYPFLNGSFALGNSIAFGYLNANNLSFVGMLGRYCGVTLTNLAVSSTGGRYAYTQLSQNKQYNYASPLLVAAPWFNDMRGTTTAQAVRYQASMASARAIAALQWLNTIQFPFSGNSGTQNSNVTYSGGTFTGAASETILQNYSSRTYWYRHNDPNNTGANMVFGTSLPTNTTMTITNVTGTSVVVGTFATDGSTNNYSPIQVSVDGVVKTTYTPNGKCDLSFADGGVTGIKPDAIVVNGLSDSTHTVVLTFTAGGKTAIDYVGTLVAAKSSIAFPIYVMDNFYMSNGSNIGYNYPGGTTTAAILDTCSNMVYANLLATYPGYRTIRVKTNTYYNPQSFSAQVNTDGIHPNILGDQLIFKGIKDSVSSYQIVGSTYPLVSIPSWDQTLSVINSTSRTAAITGYVTTDSKFKVGSFEIAPATLNNVALLENAYNNGSSYLYRSTGYASILTYYNGSFQLGGAPSGSAGAPITFNNTAKFEASGAATIGGNVDYHIGTYTGANGVFANGGLSVGTGVAPSGTFFTTGAGTTSKSQFYFPSSTAMTSPSQGMGWNDGVNLNFNNGTYTGTVSLINPTGTVVNCSTSGTATFRQPRADISSKQVIIYCNSAVGTASYTFPVAFLNTPVILNTTGVASSVVTTLTTTGCTITGATTTGYIIIEGY